MAKYSGFITLASIRDGDDGTASIYSIQTQKERIAKLYTANDGMVLSPAAIEVTAYKNENDLNNVLNLNNYDFDFDLVWENGNVTQVLTLLSTLHTTQTSQGGTSITIKDAIYSKDTSTNKHIINFNDFISVGPTETSEAANTFIAMKNALIEQNVFCLLKIYTKDSNFNPTGLLAIKTFPIEFGTSDDMAKFNVTAAAINALVGDSLMRFDAQGLTIQNGKFTINNDNGETLFGYEDGHLKVVGEGTFTGEIRATSGSFDGDVNATTLKSMSGEIGGWVINSDGLYSKFGSSLNNNIWDVSNADIKLDGNHGEIYANKIVLGNGAEIADYLKLGNAYIYNPRLHNGDFIKAGQFSVSDNGLIKNGNITLDSNTSSIYATNNGRTTFSIDPNLASFSNVNVSGKISTVVFEQDHVQAVGGSMIFKPSYKIQSVSLYTATNINTDIVLDSEFKGPALSFVYCVAEDGHLSDLTYLSGKYGNHIIIYGVLDIDTNWVSVIDMGPGDGVSIGIHSGDAENAFLKPRGITISEFKASSRTYELRTFLGDLNTLGVPNLSGFGLYGNNVYLTGSLTTELKDDNITKYAGINTLSGTKATIFSEKGYMPDNSQIVFWAGSETNREIDIQNAPFQVTQNGSLYAQQGLFSGAIITDSEIYGADIYTARIHGWTGNAQGEIANLSFYDAAKGISFFTKDGDNQDKEIFSIGLDGFISNKKPFISIHNGLIDFIGDSIHVPEYYTNGDIIIHLKENKIFGDRVIDNTYKSISGIDFNENGMSLTVYKNYDITSISSHLDLTTNLINADTDTFNITKTLTLGGKVECRPVNNGYDMYVYE